MAVNWKRLSLGGILKRKSSLSGWWGTEQVARETVHAPSNTGRVQGQVGWGFK